MEDKLILLIFLFGAHLIGDVMARPPIINRCKAKSNLVMIFHCYLWAITVSIPLFVFNIFTIEKFIFLFIGHFVIDKLKAFVDPDHDWMVGDNVNTNKYIFIDQGLHFIQLLIVGII